MDINDATRIKNTPCQKLNALSGILGSSLLAFICIKVNRVEAVAVVATHAVIRPTPQMTWPATKSAGAGEVISSFLFFFAENIREVNLIIEQGNTSSKVAVYKNGHIEASFVYKQFGVSVVAALFEKYAFTQGILSTVIDTDDELIAYLKNKLQRFVFLG